MWITLDVRPVKTPQIERFEKPLQNTDIHFGAPTFVVFGYVYKHYSCTVAFDKFESERTICFTAQNSFPIIDEINCAIRLT